MKNLSKKVFGLACASLLMMSMTTKVEEVIPKKDCIDEARAIAFYYMEYHGYSEDQGAELVLLIIEGC
ncbi:hypothetical protein FG167_05865 [Lacinutrix sp. WUR7]|uniref:hypothetical protein n=1 Tax=Lacinutrix sp. WUR7 TaxID=2653681 RepID=UPI00193DEEC3|nr:hypothetical protein [Lacinutrix sp. WUR7]QRM88779.1 hypothetical protein FG167_05865 [Lacinutrix sp. WUR7]